MTNEQDWFDSMAEAIRDRDKALAGIGRWEEKLTEAESRMAQLAANSPIAAPAAAPAPAPEAQSAPVPVMVPVASFASPDQQ